MLTLLGMAMTNIAPAAFIVIAQFSIVTACVVTIMVLVMAYAASAMVIVLGTALTNMP